MATSPATVSFILAKLGNDPRFSTRAMFGEYALYAEGKVVALVCDDMLYVKMVSASEALSTTCETGPPYPGAKPHYIVTEDQLSLVEGLPAILIAISRALPERKKKA